MNTKLLMPFRNLFRQRARTTIAISAISTGVIALLLFGGFMEWIFLVMRETTIQFRLGHVQVTRPGYLDLGTADPFAYLLPTESPTMVWFEKQPEVKAVAPRLSFSGLISHGETTVGFLGEGIDPVKEREFPHHLTIKAGKELDSKRTDEIVLGQGLAANLGVTLGDTVILLANTASGGINAVEAKVSGLFNTGNKGFDDIYLRLPLSVAKQLLRASGVHRWVILLKDTLDTKNFLGRIQARLSGPEGQFQAIPWYELSDFYNKTVTLFKRQMNVMSVIFGCLIVLGISNVMLMSVMDRTSEIGTLMALGLKRSQILNLFLAESLWLGLIGGMLGASLGYVFGEIISAVGIPMPPAPGTDESYTAEVLVTWQLATEGFFLALGTTLLAGVLPAWRASRLSVVDALRAAR